MSGDRELKPGSGIMLDIHDNPSKQGLTKSTHYQYYLQVTDAVSRFTVLLGLADMSSYSVFLCLRDYAQWFKPNPTFNASRAIRAHADFGSAFTSKELKHDCAQYNIIVTTAAPRHQEMNGICERSWATIRDMAFSFLVHGRVGYEYFDMVWNMLGKYMLAFQSGISHTRGELSVLMNISMAINLLSKDSVSLSVLV